MNNFLKNRKLQTLVFIVFFIIVLIKYSNIKRIFIKNTNDEKVAVIPQKYSISERINLEVYKTIVENNKDIEKEKEREKKELQLKKEIEDFNDTSKYDKKSEPIKIGDFVKIQMRVENFDIPREYRYIYGGDIMDLEVLVTNIKDDFISKNIIGARIGQIISFPVNSLTKTKEVEEAIKSIENIVDDDEIMNQVKNQVINNKLYYMIKIVSIKTS